MKNRVLIVVSREITNKFPQQNVLVWQFKNNVAVTNAGIEYLSGLAAQDERNNVYRAMERMPHIAAERITDFKLDTLNPLIERVLN